MSKYHVDLYYKGEYTRVFSASDPRSKRRKYSGMRLLIRPGRLLFSFWSPNSELSITWKTNILSKIMSKYHVDLYYKGEYTRVFSASDPIDTLVNFTERLRWAMFIIKCVDVH